MRPSLAAVLCLALAFPLMAQQPGPGGAATPADQMDAQPKILKLAATVDGSGRFVFTRDAARYEHGHWSPPTGVSLGGEPWPDLARTPAAWSEAARSFDLARAWVVKRRGRDVIALESTPDGFDLYLGDSPNGAADYAVTIAIPRRR